MNPTQTKITKKGWAFAALLINVILLGIYIKSTMFEKTPEIEYLIRSITLIFSMFSILMIMAIFSIIDTISAAAKHIANSKKKN